MVAMDRHPYMASIREEPGTPGEFRITFVPRGLQHARGIGGAPGRIPRFVVWARRADGGFALDWGETPDDPGAARADLEREVPVRLRDRDIWIGRVTKLADQVESWSRELGWVTRRIDKRLEDSWVGNHVVPAVLMQKDTCRVLLEPVGQSVPGADGVVDLYLMPAYDDIASLYFYDGQWNLHYMRHDQPAVATVREAARENLSRDSLERVLEDMKAHAT